MKFVDKFVLVPVKKWEEIALRENPVRKENWSDSSQMNPVTQVSPQPNFQKIKPETQIPISTPPLKKKQKIMQKSKKKIRKKIIWNTAIKHLKGKGENNLPTSLITPTIISRIPKKYKNRVGALLHYLKRSPDLKWIKNGVLYLKGKKIEDSNVADLAYNAVREDDNSKPPGYQIFYEHIIDAGVPLFFIKNKIGLKIIYQTLQSIDNDWRPPGTLVKKYKPKEKLDWNKIK